MKTKELVSIIVPVYNVEKYLDKCVESVLNQTYNNIEILLIDDGSTDDSGKMCDEYSKKYKKIRVFHKENGGLSSARNYGIDNAKGEYLTFVDSDDTVESDYVEILYKIIKTNNVKLSIGAYSIITKNKNINIGSRFKDCTMNTEKCLADMFQENGFTVSANAKMYHKSLFRNIKYPEGKLYEDNGTTYKLVMECDRISYTNQSVYNYYMRKGSITNQKFSMRKMDYITLTDMACNDVLKKYPKIESECKYRQAVARLSVLRQMYSSKLSSDEVIERKKLTNYFINNYKNIMNNRCTSSRMKISLRLLKTSKFLFKVGVRLYERIK